MKKITAQCQCNIILEGMSNDKFCNSVFLLIYRICCWKVSIDVEYSIAVQYPYCTKIFSNMQHEMQFSVSNVWDATDIIQLPGGVLVLGKEPAWESSCIVHAFCNLPLSLKSFPFVSLATCPAISYLNLNNKIIVCFFFLNCFSFSSCSSSFSCCCCPPSQICPPSCHLGISQ